MKSRMNHSRWLLHTLLFLNGVVGVVGVVGLPLFSQSPSPSGSRYGGMETEWAASNHFAPDLAPVEEEFSWQPETEEATWGEWVERLIGGVESDEEIEEISSLLIRLERWYHHPRDLNALTVEEINTFFWLTPREVGNILDYRRTNSFTTVADLRPLLSPDNYFLTQTFLRVRKTPAPSSAATEIRYGLALRAKELTGIEDFPELFKNYQIKIFGEIQQAGVFDFHYLAERDTNETRILDLEKWSLSVNWPWTSSLSEQGRSQFTLTGGALSVKIQQSLLMATGYRQRKNERAPYTVKRNTSHIQNDKSSQEIFLQGLAADYVFDSWRIAIWAGEIRYDNPLFTNASEQIYAQEYSPYPTLHRPFPEFTLRENLFGLLLEKQIGYHTLSTAFLYSRFSHPLWTSEPDEFFGQSHWGWSGGWDLDFNRFRWYGEAVFLMNEKHRDPWSSPSYRGSGAMVSGGRLFFPESDLFLSFRLIPESYQAAHNLTYTRYSGNDEIGILGGYRLRPRPSFTSITSFDFFKQWSGRDPSKFGMDISQLFTYRHLSGYYNDSQFRLRERGEWEDRYNHFWEVRHRSGWRDPSWHLFTEVKISGNLITEIIGDHPPFGLLLSLHGEYRSDLLTSVVEVMWSRAGPLTLYDLVYHNRFFNDLLSLNQDTFLLFFRQGFRFHPLFQIGFSLGLYWDSSESKLFHPPQPSRVMFSFYVNGETGD